MSLLLAVLLTQAGSTDPSISKGARTAALIGVGVGTPAVGAGVGALIALPSMNACVADNRSLCGLHLAIGLLAGGVAGLVLMPFALLLADHLLPPASAAPTRTGTIVGGLVGLAVGLAAGVGLTVLGSAIHSASPEGEVVLVVLGGVLAIGAPITGALIGSNVQQASTPTVAVVPLAGGLAVTLSGRL